MTLHLDEKASLKRVLLKIKGEARGMRKGNLEARLNPKPKAVVDDVEEPAEDTGKAPISAKTETEAEAPDADTKAARAKEIASIRSLLARV